MIKISYESNIFISFKFSHLPIIFSLSLYLIAILFRSKYKYYILESIMILSSNRISKCRSIYSSLK